MVSPAASPADAFWTCAGAVAAAGDALVLSIAAASIVAKVTRDRLMRRIGAMHPGYGFERHMGYGVPEHVAALRALGPTIHHRRSFAPVRLRLAQDQTGLQTATGVAAEATVLPL